MRALLVGAFLTTCGSVVSFFLFMARLNEALRDNPNIAIDVSPDSVQRDVGIALALLLGGIGSVSRASCRRVLVASGILYFGLEAFCWFGAPHATFDSPTPLSHVIFGVALATAATLYHRGAPVLAIVACAPLSVCALYALWSFETYDLRRLAGVDVLPPDTVLDNLLYGAEWHHVLTLTFSSLVLIPMWIGARRSEKLQGEVSRRS
jgi:hypothetical protein